MENKFVKVSFNVEMAKKIQNKEIEGKIVTRDGRKARIICFDKGGEQPIVALIKNNEEESIDTFFSNGHSISKTNEVAGDLMMMLPEKKEGWVNVYRDCDGANITKDENSCVATIKINWRE